MKKSDIKGFAPQLHALCASVMADNRSPEDAAEVIEELTAALAFSISLATGGDNALASKMIAGVESYLTERCAGFQRVGKLFDHVRREAGK